MICYERLIDLRSQKKIMLVELYLRKDEKPVCLSEKNMIQHDSEYHHIFRLKVWKILLMTMNLIMELSYQQGISFHF